MLEEEMESFVAAIHADLGRPRMESVAAEISHVVAEADHAISNLKRWMKTETVSTGLLQRPGYSQIVREPKGVVLIISPWNFPIDLSVQCVVSAVAAGNCCLLKPSEISASCAEVLTKLIPKYLDNDAVQVMPGGVPETTALINLPWDHIMYTGNGSVARTIAQAAAKNLVPCTLELGGKSPTIVLPGTDLKQAAKRILWGKCFNVGQVCIAPDYILVHDLVESELVEVLQATLKEWYGEDASKSAHFGRIINKKHFQRIKNLLDKSDGTILPQLGRLDEDTCFIPPTLVRNPSRTSPLLQEEIFGPILPIVKASSVDDMISHVNQGDKPLAMYIFGKRGPVIDEIIQRTSSGNVCVNDTVLQYANPHLPFGGVGASGIGKCHGKWGFDELSNARSVMYRDTWVDLPQRYPPYSEANTQLFQWLLVGPWITPSVKKLALGAVAVSVVAMAIAAS